MKSGGPNLMPAECSVCEEEVAVEYDDDDVQVSDTPAPDFSLVGSVQSVSPNAAKTDDDETRMKNYVKGVTSVFVMLEI